MLIKAVWVFRGRRYANQTYYNDNNDNGDRGAVDADGDIDMEGGGGDQQSKRLLVYCFI